MAFLRRARTATVLAAAGALLAVGVVAGAAGDYMILGVSNNSGTAQTVLQNAGLGAAFTLRTTNTSSNATGIFGWSSQTGTNATRGVYGRVDGENSYGVYAVQNGAAGGAGAALYAIGNNNQAIVATSDEDTAITATATSCTGFLCGSAGVWGTGAGFTGGVVGTGEGSITGVWGAGPTTYTGYGVLGTASTADNSVGVYGSACNGVQGLGSGGDTIDTSCGDGSGFFAAGGLFSGDNGVVGQSGGAGYGVGVVAEQGTGAYAIYSTGLSVFQGDVTITGTCTGCAAAIVGVNSTSGQLHQGDAVAIRGVSLGADGRPVVLVGPASKNDRVLGIVDRSVSYSPERVTIGGGTQRVAVPDGGWTTVAIPTRTVKAQNRSWIAGGTTVAAGASLRIVTSGMFAYKPATSMTFAAGDALAVGSADGTLAKAGSDTARGAVAGSFLGTLNDGRIVILVAPN